MILDLRILSGGLAYGADGEPEILTGAAAVAQDVAHLLIEAGLNPDLIGLTTAEVPAKLREMALAIETDPRVTPGTATVRREGTRWIFTAETTLGAINGTA